MDRNRLAGVCKAVLQDFRFRIGLVSFALLLVFLCEGAKLVYLHTGDHAKISRMYKKTLPGMRGRIYDRNGKDHPLATSMKAWQFFLDPMSVKPGHSREAIARAVAANLGLDEGWVRRQFGRTGRGSRYIRLAVSSSDAVWDALVKDPGISGVGADEMVIRKYPQGRRMSHVLGFVNSAGVGSAGIEQAYDQELSGAPGMIEGETDARCKEIFVRRKTFAPPIPGHDVHLTLDSNIQYEAETALRQTVDRFDALRGWVIVQRVKTGELLALAACPDFDPARYGDSPAEVWANYALGTVYEPGSIMKAVTVSAYLNERLGTPGTLFDAGQGIWFYANKPLRDHARGLITVAEALKKSSNIVCAKIGLALGDKRFHAYLRAFNFGSKFGIEAPGEEAGILPPFRKWSKLSPTRIAIGQGIAVTGLQMVTAYSAIANGGVMMRPYLVDRIVSADGEVIRQNRPEIIGRPVRREVADQVRGMLTGVTEAGGTGRRARVPGYSVAGKTGTAQMVVPSDPEDPHSRRVYSNTDYFASFVGFLPASAPEFTVLVTVVRPRPQHMGGLVAAPAFAKIAAATARYLEIPPDRPEEIEEEEEGEE